MSGYEAMTICFYIFRQFVGKLKKIKNDVIIINKKPPLLRVLSTGGRRIGCNYSLRINFKPAACAAN
jgi:hypothetical protein